MNKCILIGNVCHTPETRVTSSGKSVSQFEIAVNEKRGGEDRTEYIRVSAWNKLGEICQQYLGKGRKVCVIGKIGARAYIGKDGAAKYQLELTADDVEFLSAADQQKPEQPKSSRLDSVSFEEIVDKDLPF